MKSASILQYVSAVAAAGALAACGGASSSIPAYSPQAATKSAASESVPASRALLGEARSRGLLFASSGSKNTVFIFPESGGTKPLGKIVKGLDFPGAMTVDRSANLYVANGGNNTVVKFAPPYTGAPTLTYSNGISGPTGLSVARDGTLYVAEATSGPLSGQIVVFPSGATLPSLTIPITFPFGIATDSRDNLYVSPGTIPDVEKFSPGSTTGKLLGLKGLLAPEGLAFDSSGNLVVVDEGIGTRPAIDVFAAGAQTPLHSFTNNLTVPVTVAIATDDQHVFIGDSGSSSQPESILDFTYPTGAKTGQISNIGFDFTISPPSQI